MQMPERPEVTLHMIRLCWRADVVHEEAAEPRRSCGPWFPRTIENIRTLSIMLECGLETYGAGSHWIDEREA